MKKIKMSDAIVGTCIGAGITLITSLFAQCVAPVAYTHLLSEKFIKELHLILKNGTSDSRKDWFAVGDYKKLPNEVGGVPTACLLYTSLALSVIS